MRGASVVCPATWGARAQDRRRGGTYVRGVAALYATHRAPHAVGPPHAACRDELPPWRPGPPPGATHRHHRPTPPRPPPTGSRTRCHRTRRAVEGVAQTPGHWARPSANSPYWQVTYRDSAVHVDSVADLPIPCFAGEFLQILFQIARTATKVPAGPYGRAASKRKSCCPACPNPPTLLIALAVVDGLLRTSGVAFTGRVTLRLRSMLFQLLRHELSTSRKSAAVPGQSTAPGAIWRPDIASFGLRTLCCILQSAGPFGTLTWELGRNAAGFPGVGRKGYAGWRDVNAGNPLLGRITGRSSHHRNMAVTVAGADGRDQ